MNHPEIPVPGAEFRDGYSPGFRWRVITVAHETVHLELFRDDRPVDSYMEWPLNRWHVLFDRGVLVP